MSVQCKAYLLEDGAKEPKEIRSFRLDEGAASNYDYLRKKIATIFPNLGWEEDGSAFTLLWKDNAGDMVTFSSDEELIDALGEIPQDGIFRVYIKHSKKQSGDFPWQAHVNEFLKPMQEQAQNEGRGPFGHPYARGGGCGGRRGCGRGRGRWGSQRRRCPGGFFIDAFDPRMFPGFHAEVWAFDGDDFEDPRGCCGQWQGQRQTNQQEKPNTTPMDTDKPSTSS